MTIAHSKIGASSAKRWMNCPGSVALCEGLPNVSSEFAKEGTDAHMLAEYILTHRNPKIIPDVLLGYPVPKEMEEAVRVYVDFLAEDYIDGDEVDFEVRFDLSSLFPGMFGTADAVRYRPSNKSLRVTDYKHGAGVAVEVTDNPQLLYYALGACYAKQNRGIRTIELCVVQPRCPHSDGVIRIWTIDAVQLMDFTADITAAAERTRAPDAVLAAGDWCRWCPASAICPELSRIANETCKREFGEGSKYDAFALSETLERLPLIEAWVNGVRSFAYNEAEAGRCPPGFKLVEKRATRKWKDEETARDLFVRKYEIPRDSMFEEPKMKSPAQMERVLGKNKSILEELVVAVSSGNTLAPLSDRRPASVKRSAQDDFADCPEIE